MNKFLKALLGLFDKASSGKKSAKTKPLAVKGRVILSKGRMATKEQKIGKVIHLYHKINVAILELSKPLKVGDRIHFVGSITDADQSVASLQIDHKAVLKGAKGEQVGILLDKGVIVREGDIVYLAQ